MSPKTQREVYRTVGLRAKSCDATWAPWWRATARAEAENALARGVYDEPGVAFHIGKEDSFATFLEDGKNDEHEARLVVLRATLATARGE